MRRLWIGSLLLLSFMRPCLTTTNKVTYWCMQGQMNTVVMEFEIYNDNTKTPITAVTAIDQTTNTPIAGCASPAVITGAGTIADPMKLTVVITDIENTATIDKQCGHTITSPIIYKWVFRITTGSPVSIPGISFGSDGDETLTCQFDPVVNPIIGAQPTVENVPMAGDGRVTVSPYIEEVLMIVADPVTNEKKVEATFASNAILYVQLNTDNTKSGAKGVSVSNCIICPTSECDTDTVTIIDAKGLNFYYYRCETDQEIFDTSAVKGFTSKRNVATGVGAETVYSNVFKVFRFSSGNFVYFKCDISYCYEYDAATGNKYCDDRCADSSTKRKRRSSDSGGSRQAMAVLRVPWGPSLRNDTPQGTDQSCFQQPVMVAMVPTLGVLSLLAAICAFVSCGFLHKTITSRQKYAQT